MEYKALSWWEHYCQFCDKVDMSLNEDEWSKANDHIDWVIPKSDSQEDIEKAYAEAEKIRDLQEMAHEMAFHICKTSKGFAVTDYSTAKTLGF